MINLQSLADEILHKNDTLIPGWEYEIASGIEKQIYWTNALAGEVGELCNGSKKHHRFLKGWTERILNDEEYKEYASDELADIFIYMILYSRVLDIDLPKVIKKKIDKIHGERFKVER